MCRLTVCAYAAAPNWNNQKCKFTKDDGGRQLQALVRRHADKLSRRREYGDPISRTRPDESADQRPDHTEADYYRSAFAAGRRAIRLLFRCGTNGKQQSYSSSNCPTPHRALACAITARTLDRLNISQR